MNSSLSQSISDLRGPKQGGYVSQKQPILGPKSQFPTFTPTVWELFGYSLGISWALQKPPLGTWVVYFVVSIALIERFQSQNWAPRVASKKPIFSQKTRFPTFWPNVWELFVSSLGISWALQRPLLGARSAFFVATLARICWFQQMAGILIQN